MISRLKTIGFGLLDLIYPPACLVCGADVAEGALCEACVGLFKPIVPPFCDRCGEPISVNRIICKRCEEGIVPAYDWSQAPFQYDGAVLRAIHRLKYESKAALAEPLGRLLAASLDTKTHLIDPDRDPKLPPFDLMIPVPLHTGRMRRRGFNQAERIAQVVATERNLRLAADVVKRVKRTPSQTALTHDERAANIRGAFRVIDPTQVEGKSVLIVDDVLTSTSTARELARVIAEEGCSRVCVLALARSV